MATCGNYGVAVAQAASLAGLRCIVYVPESYHTRRTGEMERFGAEVVRAAGDYETAVELSRGRADVDDVYDANPGGANTPLQLRAYGEINDFEEELDKSGVIVVKFWLSISAEEQLRRFEAREEIEYKKYKITAEDWRNRGKWDAYRLAIGDMIDRTSTPYAPWTLIEAEDKRWARVKVLETLCERIEQSL